MTSNCTCARAVLLAVPLTLVILALGGAACGGHADQLHGCNAQGLLCGEMESGIPATGCPAGTMAVSSCSAEPAIGRCSYSGGTLYIYDESVVADALAECQSKNGVWEGPAGTSSTTPGNEVLICRDHCFALYIACYPANPDDTSCSPFRSCAEQCAKDEEDCLAWCENPTYGEK